MKPRPAHRPAHFAHAFSRAALGALAIAASPLPACKDRGPNAKASAPHDEHEHEGEHTDEVALTPEAIDRYGVKVEEAQLWVLRPTFVAPARIGLNTEAMAHVGSPLRGRAVDIHARLGDAVTKGAPLVTIESPELGQAQADYLLKRTAAQAAAPQVDLSKAAWDRAKGLLERSEGISLTEVQKREAEYRTAVAAQRSAEAAALAAENGLHLLGMDQQAVERLAATGEIAPRYVLRAPLDGQVLQRHVTLGELVGPERESLMLLADARTLWVLADVPEARLHSVPVGAKAIITVGSGPRAGGYEGRVAFISPQVDPDTRTAQVRVELPADAPGAAAFRPGMFAQAEIVQSPAGGVDPPPQIAVPEAAVQTVEGGPAVFVPVPGEPNTFQLRPLRVGPKVGDLLPVLAGLVEGEKFVSGGSFILKAELGKAGAEHHH